MSELKQTIPIPDLDLAQRATIPPVRCELYLYMLLKERADETKSSMGQVVRVALSEYLSD